MKKNLFSILSFLLLITLVIVAVAFILKGNEEDPVYSDIVELFENIGVNGEESVKTFTLEASKSTKLIKTSSSTYRCLKGPVLSSTLSSHCFSITSSTANISPHSTKFHAAPCHNPVSIHTTKMLKYQRHLGTLFPPMGIYT